MRIHTISAELAADELELVQSVFHAYVTKHREKAKLEHVLGKMSEAELAWCQRHAAWAESVFKKLVKI